MTSMRAGSNAANCEARPDRSRRKAHLELASAQTLLVDRKPEPPILEQRRARIVAVPDTNYVHEASMDRGVTAVRRTGISPGSSRNEARIARR